MDIVKISIINISIFYNSRKIIWRYHRIRKFIHDITNGLSIIRNLEQALDENVKINFANIWKIVYE